MTMAVNGFLKCTMCVHESKTPGCNYEFVLIHIPEHNALHPERWEMYRTVKASERRNRQLNLALQHGPYASSITLCTLRPD